VHCNCYEPLFVGGSNPASSANTIKYEIGGREENEEQRGKKTENCM
jgi:hypothetical protein